MKKRSGKTTRFLFFVNLFFVLVALVALLVPAIPVSLIPTLSVISFLVPLLVCIHFLFVLYWIAKKRKLWVWSAVILLAWYTFLGSFYQFSSPKEKDNGSTELTIMSFNVRSFNKYGWIKNENVENEIMHLIKSQNPDILCFQEFNMRKKRGFSDYPYSYQTPHGTNKTFQIFFTKTPIIKGGTLDFPSTRNNGLFIDVMHEGDTIRIYDVHLQSFQIVPEMTTFKNVEPIRLLQKLKKVMLKQYEQAQLVRANMEQISHKKIVVGDFNNTQYSNIYKTIKGNMSDSYLEGGNGFGRTYNLLGYPMRIDYILTDPAFEIVSHKNFDEKLSDHYPIMATLQLKKNQ